MPLSVLTIFAMELIGVGAYQQHTDTVSVLDVFGIVTLPSYFRRALHEYN